MLFESDILKGKSTFKVQIKNNSGLREEKLTTGQ